jgi:hypothetical protein
MEDSIIDFFNRLTRADDWPARWHCGIWSDFHGWLYILSDIAIGLAYFAIPFLLLYFMRNSRQRSLNSTLLLFAVFIMACGCTHFLDAILFWWPVYRLSALVRFITAVASWWTVITLTSVIPQALRMKTPAELQVLIAERTEELTNRNHQLEEMREQIQHAYEDLELKVKFRNLELERKLRDLEVENAKLKDGFS